MEVNTKPLLDGVLKLLNVCGFNPFVDNLFAKVRCYVSTIVIFTYFCEMLFGALSRGNIEDVLFDIPATMGLELFTLKMIILNVKRYQLKDILNDIIKKYWKTDRYGQELHLQLQANYKSLKKLVITIMGLYLCTSYSLFINPPQIKSRTLPYALYHVAKSHAPLKDYLIAYFSQLIVLTVMGLSVYCAFYFLFVILIVYNINELKLIKKGLMDMCNKPGEDLDELRALVYQHTLVLKSINQVNNVFFIFMTNVLLSTTIITCLSLINILSRGFPPHVTSICLIVLFMSMLFFFCFLGNLLATESQSVAETVYQCNWWQKNKTELRKQLVLIMIRSQKPARLTAANLNLEFDTFTAIIKLTFNFFTFTFQLLNNKNK